MDVILWTIPGGEITPFQYDVPTAAQVVAPVGLLVVATAAVVVWLVYRWRSEGNGDE